MTRLQAHQFPDPAEYRWFTVKPDYLGVPRRAAPGHEQHLGLNITVGEVW